MQIHELTPPAEIPPPEWHRQLARFVRSASDHDRIDMRVALEMRDRDTAVRLLESYSDAAVLERKRAKKKRKAAKKRTFKYGRFGGWWYPGFHDDSGATADGDGGGGESVREASTPDGVSPSTRMFLSETEKTNILKDFIARTMQRLRLADPPRVVFHKNSTWAEQNRSFGQFDPDTNTLHVSLPDRHVMDIMRTIAHELTHAKQNEKYQLPDTAGETGSRWENSANAMAGIIMRDMAQANPGLFEAVTQDININEGLNRALASAALAAAMTVIPAAAQDQPQDQQQAQGPSVKQVLNTALRLYGISRIREPQVRAEVEQEFKNYLRAQQGDPNAQNQSKIYQWERQLDEGASGYIPTKRQARDPRFKTALTVDIKPGQVGREANKLGLQTDSQGRPNLLAKQLANALREFKEGVTPVAPVAPAGSRTAQPQWSKQKGQRPDGGAFRDALKQAQTKTTEAKKKGSHGKACWKGYRRVGTDDCVKISEDQELTEVDMSPGALQKWAKSDAAQRIRVGFEFEMYFPDTVDADRDDDYGDSDYPNDEEADSISDIIRFFSGGNNPTARRVLNRVEEGLYETFAQWRQDQIADEASSSGFYNYMEENEPDLREDKIEEFRQEARTELGDDASEEAVDERTQDLYGEWIDDQYSRGSRYYDDYMEWLSDSLGDSYDESEWLRSEMRYMSDVAQEEDLDWPYINERGGGSGRTADDWAQELAGVIGMPVKTGSYHGSQRGEDHANLEPDGSLSEPKSDQDAGLELITPYRPLPEAMQILDNVIQWADRNGIYTNSSTGLHMNVSIEGVKNVDWVKLVLFLGDRYILDQFDRRYKMYASSSLDRIEAKVRDAQPVQEQDEDQAIYGGKMDIEKALQMMRNNSIELARRAIQSGMGREKYQSVHVKELRDGSYIEFRGPGNDWLQKAQETERGLADTVYRLGRAMTIAADPEAERQEYARKLYKILTPEDPNRRSSMKLFADYSAGVISREELKRTWAEQVLQAQRRGRDREAQAEYDIVDRDTGEVIDTFTAVGDNYAIEKARDRVPAGINYDVRLHDREVALSPKERRRSELAQRVAGKPIWWRVSDKGGNYTGHVQAPTASKAIDNFMQQEPAAMRISRDRFEARPEDPPTVTQSSTDPSTVDLNALPPGESDFMVTWDEFRTHEGREVRVSDALRTTARNAAEAARRVHDSLQMQGREAFNLNAEPTDPPAWRRNRDVPAAATDNITNPLHQTTDDTTERKEYHIFYRDTNRPVVAFMAASDEEALVRLDRFRREYPRSGDVGVRAAPGATRAQTTPSGEWTGRWLVQSTVTGETVHTISGIGNVQDDANRHAERWVRSTGFDDPIEVVPEMQ
jgi:hypothetical protein